MGENKCVKIVFYVPKTHLEPALNVLHQNGCGQVGNGKYEGAAFLTFGHGTWIALKGSKPFKGRLNRREMIQEVRVESTCAESKVFEVVKILRSIHPYEEPVIEVYPLESATPQSPLKSPLEIVSRK